jgi:hypothetical protein
MLKKYLAATLLFIALPIQAAELTSYKAIEDTLTQGNLITMVLKVDACKINNPTPIPIKATTIIFKPQTIMFSNEGYFAASGSWFTSKIPTSTGNGVNQQYKILLNNQNQAKISWEFFDADTGHKSAIKTIDGSCELGKGFKVYGHSAS